MLPPGNGGRAIVAQRIRGQSYSQLGTVLDVV
jgi:hypothetical protein